jgi:light-regulated signal transduction histidine kinase (bacteriophytochrome)
MQVLINDLLMFSRVGRTTERFERVGLDEVLQLAWRDVAADDTDATLDSSELPSVAGDPALLHTLFANLVSNAIKFRSDAPPAIRVSAVQHDDSWHVTVQDNGIGIDPQFADRIFDIFQRLHTRDVYDGTGIGLAICKRIVEFHGGTIRLVPSDDGACFLIELPVLADDADVAAPPEPLIPYRPEGSPQ